MILFGGKKNTWSINKNLKIFLIFNNFIIFDGQKFNDFFISFLDKSLESRLRAILAAIQVLRGDYTTRVQRYSKWSFNN